MVVAEHEHGGVHVVGKEDVQHLGGMVARERRGVEHHAVLEPDRAVDAHSGEVELVAVEELERGLRPARGGRQHGNAVVLEFSEHGAMLVGHHDVGTPQRAIEIGDDE